MREWVNRHQLAVALLVLLAVVVPGYVRVEGIVNDIETERTIRRGANCVRAIETREDNRAMWLYVFAVLDPNATVEEARAELDRRLPSLECDDTRQPVPVTTTP